LSFLRWLDDFRYRSRISIVLAGGPVLAQFRDPEDRGSPPLNCADFDFIEPFDLAAIAELVMLDEKSPDMVDPDLLLNWSGGNAWLAAEVMARIWLGEEFAMATEAVHDQAVAKKVFRVWQLQAGNSCLEFLRCLPAEGADRARLIGGDLSRYRESVRFGRA